MTIHLSPEQEHRLQAVIERGSYESIDEVMEAALAAVEQRSAPPFDGTSGELESKLLDGLASRKMTEDEFWESVNSRTDALLAEYRAARRS